MLQEREVALDPVDLGGVRYVEDRYDLEFFEDLLGDVCLEHRKIVHEDGEGLPQEPF